MDNDLVESISKILQTIILFQSDTECYDDNQRRISG